MKGKNIVIIILVLIAIVAIAGTVVFGIKYKNTADEVENLNSEITKLNEQINSEEVEEKETKPEQEIAEEFKNVKYDPNKIVNTDRTYGENYYIGSTRRGILEFKGNELTFSVEISASDYSYSVTYDAKETIVDAARGTGGQGMFEITAIVTESGKVYTNTSFGDDGANELLEVQNLPKICRVVYTTSSAEVGTYYDYGGTIIAIDEEGNGYDLLRMDSNQ